MYAQLPSVSSVIRIKLNSRISVGRMEIRRKEGYTVPKVISLESIKNPVTTCKWAQNKYLEYIGDNEKLSLTI